jgi:hypothetical protein
MSDYKFLTIKSDDPFNQASFDCYAARLKDTKGQVYFHVSDFAAGWRCDAKGRTLKEAIRAYEVELIERYETEMTRQDELKSMY